MLQPHRLPYAGGTGVKATVGLIGGLLAAGLFLGAQAVVHADGDGVLPRHQRVGDVKGEGDKAPAVLSHRLSVDPHPGAVVARAHAQAHPPADPRGREGDGAAIPHVLTVGGVSDARQHALAAKRDDDGLAEGRIGGGRETAHFTGTIAVGVERPRAVEQKAGSLAAVKLRGGTFGARHGGGGIRTVRHGAYLISIFGDGHAPPFLPHYSSLRRPCHAGRKIFPKTFVS